MKKKYLLFPLMLLMIIVLITSCSKAKTDNETLEGKLKVSLIVADKLGDKSFFDSAFDGVSKAKSELGVEVKVFECKNDTAEFSEQLAAASQFGNVVFAVGYEFYDLLKEASKSYPKVDYVYIDNVIKGYKNLSSLDYNEVEGSFLAGALAALMTTDTSIKGINPDKIIGMVGGMDIPVIQSFEDGFRAGAKFIDPSIKVINTFSGDFVNTKNCKKAAKELFDKGADIVFAVAGGAGLGAFDAASERGRYVIGVDSDQRYINPNVIIASMEKGIGVSIYDCIKKITNKTYTPGSVYSYGLKEKGVDIVYGDSTMKQIVPLKIRERISGIRDDIISGKIKP